MGCAPFYFIGQKDSGTHHVGPMFALATSRVVFNYKRSTAKLGGTKRGIGLFIASPRKPRASRVCGPVPFFVDGQKCNVFVRASTPIAYSFNTACVKLGGVFVNSRGLSLFIFFNRPGSVLSRCASLMKGPNVPPL